MRGAGPFGATPSGNRPRAGLCRKAQRMPYGCRAVSIHGTLGAGERRIAAALVAVRVMLAMAQ